MSDPSTTGTERSEDGLVTCGGDNSGSGQPSDCPSCGSIGYVTRNTGPGEAECIDEDCPEGVYEVRDDGHSTIAGDPCDVCGGEVVEAPVDRECEDCNKRFPPIRTDGGVDEPGTERCSECGATFCTGDVQNHPEDPDRLAAFRKCANGHVEWEGIDDGLRADGGSERSCSLCDEPAVTLGIEVENEETGETAQAVFCEEHLDKLERYNDGEEVDFDV